MKSIEPRAQEPRPVAELAPTWEYDAAPETRDIVHLEPRYGLFIGGRFVEAKSGRTFETIDPAAAPAAPASVSVRGFHRGCGRGGHERARAGYGTAASGRRGAPSGGPGRQWPGGGEQRDRLPDLSTSGTI